MFCIQTTACIICLFFSPAGGPGTNVVAIDNKIEQAMVRMHCTPTHSVKICKDTVLYLGVSYSQNNKLAPAILSLNFWKVLADIVWSP